MSLLENMHKTREAQDQVCWACHLKWECPGSTEQKNTVGLEKGELSGNNPKSPSAKLGFDFHLSGSTT